MKTKKKILISLFAVLTAITLITLTAYAADGGNEASVTVNGVTTEYSTLAEAVKEAGKNEGSVLTLLKNITLETVQYINSGIFTLDLNGKILLCETAAALRLHDSTQLTIKDSGIGGTVQSNAPTSPAIFNYAVLNIESGTITGDAGISVFFEGVLTVKNGEIKGKNYPAIINYALAHVYNGTLTSETQTAIENVGTLYVYGGVVEGISAVTCHKTAYISGGEFTGTSSAAVSMIADAKLEITGGSFRGTLGGKETTVYYSPESTLTIAGGQFPNGFYVENATDTSYLPENHFFYDENYNKLSAEAGVAVEGNVQIREAFVAVVKDKNGVEVGFYNTVDSAVAVAEELEGSTVILTEDCASAEKGWVEITKGSFAIDLNGKTLSENNSNTALILSGGDLTLFDDNEIPGYVKPLIAIHGGALTIESGCFPSVGLFEGSLLLKGGSFDLLTVHHDTGKTIPDVLSKNYHLRDREGRIVDSSMITAAGANDMVQFVTVSLGANLATEAKVTVDNVTYSGTEQEPAVTVTVGDTVLVPNTDYTVEYTNNLNAGTATATVTGMGAYSGTVTVTFEIEKATVTESDLLLDGLTPTYDGNTHEATVSSLPLGLEAQYVTILYMQNGSPLEGMPKNAGTYDVSVSIQGSPNYNDVLLLNKWRLVISPRSATVVVGTPLEEYFFNGYAHTPNVYLDLGQLPFPVTEYEGCIVTYENNTEVGTATVTVSGNYTGSATFEIQKGKPTLTLESPLEMVMPGYVLELTPRTSAIDNFFYPTTFTILPGEGYTVNGNQITVNSGVVNGSTITVKVTSTETKNYSAAEGELVLTVGIPVFDPSGLEEDISELQGMIDQKADAAEITQKLSEITEQLRALEEAYKGADETLKQEMESKLAGVKDTLSGTIQGLESKLDEQVTALQGQISANGTNVANLQTEIATMNGLIDQLKAADTAFNGQVSDAVTKAETELKAAKEALEALIGAVRAELEKAVQDLNQALTSGKSELSEEIDTLNAAIAAASSALEAADEADKSALTAQLNDARTALDGAIKALQGELLNVKTTLEEKDASLQTFIIIVCVISGLSFCGCGTLAGRIFLERRKKING